MLSKAKIKYIKSLQLKKHRESEGLFIVEGEKSVLEFVRSDFNLTEIFATDAFLNKNSSIIKKLPCSEATAEQLAQAGTYKTNDAALAVVRIPDQVSWRPKPNTYSLALDSINDPGNLGTIIRLADWYGLRSVLISKDSVDLYSPKVVNSTKGSLSRVRVHIVDLAEVLSSYSGTVYGADLKGENVHELQFATEGILVMGSESHGLSADVKKANIKKVTIPSFGEAESLNVAVATGIMLDNLARSR